MAINKQLRKYVLPNILAMMGMSCYILADTFFVSEAEGTNGITALNLALPIYGLIFAFGSMIGIGSATRYALCKANNDKLADNYFSNALLWDIVIGLIFASVGLFFPENVLKLMGADSEILSVGTSYLKIAMSFSPLFMLNYTFTAFVRNDGAPKTAMAATLISSFFNIAFDYIFMFPLGMGMKGAALATGMSPAVSMIVCSFHYLSKKNNIKLKIMFPSLKNLIASCNLGIVAFVGEIANGITTMAFNFILLGIAGNTAVAAYGVVANIALVGTSVFNGISQGLQPLASEAHGRGDANSEKGILKQSVAIGVLMAVFITAFVCIFAGQLTNVFNSDGSKEMAAYAVPGLRIYFTGFIVAAVNIVRAGYFSAIGNAKESAVIAVLRGIFVIVFFVFLLSKLLGITGVWLSFPATEIFTLIVTLGIGKRNKA